MKRIIVTAAVAVLLLSGCTASTPATSPTPGSPSASASATPTPSPSPTALSLPDAGEAYLAIVCPNNALVHANNDAFAAQDLVAIQTTAAAARDGSQVAALAFDDVEWPEELVEDTTAVQNIYFAATSYYQQVADSPTLDAANVVALPTETGEASQRIRARTGLSADTTASCQ